MYSYNRLVIVGLLVGYAAIFITGMVLAGLNMQVVGCEYIKVEIAFRLKPLTLISTSLPRAVTPHVPPQGGVPSWAVANWFLMMAFDLGMFALAIAEAIRYIRRHRFQHTNLLQSSRTFRGSKPAKRRPMIVILLRDSISFPLM